MSKWSQELEEDLKWREAELGSLKLQVVKATQSSVKQALLRAMWALLYAHYEGFCKFAWDLYLDELRKTGVKRKDCQDAIARLSLENNFKEMRGNLSALSIWEFGQTQFKSLLEENLDFQVKLETDSNLWPHILKDNTLQAGLNCTLVDRYEVKLRALVSRRNGIAHGQKMIIKDIHEYQEYENAALEVMHDLAVAIVECLDCKLYLKNP
ncbi:MAG: MAE_28990/MAE_18760 family HEPN-like nuclease [Microcoleus sp.]